jgi:2-polyprenyl-6-hydroxyphenyl methylase/3-demethylubiquinone-9 3-methyltransferase
MPSVESAMSTLARLVAEQHGGDTAYFRGQGHRFRYTASRIHERCGRPSRILDIGSHYLHQAGILRLLGHEVVGLDVPLFANAEFVVERSRRLGLPNHSVDSLEEGRFLLGWGYDGTFDAVIFTAILEHITFNPVRFWRRVYELLTDRGFIYLTTPNGLRPAAMVRHLARLVCFAGVGPPVERVLNTVTYGNHWKEYSSTEIRRYFHMLSPDFRVKIGWYDDSELATSLGSALVKWAGIVPAFRPEIEAVISLSGKSGRFLAPPALPIMRQDKAE